MSRQRGQHIPARLVPFRVAHSASACGGWRVLWHRRQHDHFSAVVRQGQLRQRLCCSGSARRRRVRTVRRADLCRRRLRWRRSRTDTDSDTDAGAELRLRRLRWWHCCITHLLQFRRRGRSWPARSRASCRPWRETRSQCHLLVFSLQRRYLIFRHHCTHG